MISMDGKGRCMDNIFVERLWRSLKYEEVYLNAYATVAEARTGIGAWLCFYTFRAGSASGGSAAGRQRRSSIYPQAFLVNLPRRAIAEALVLTLLMGATQVSVTLRVSSDRLRCHGLRRPAERLARSPDTVQDY
jgi:hypothetical protein